MKITTDEYIKKVINIHGDLYDYSLTTYINNRTKIKIICSKHGEVYISPKMHLKGSKCQQCSNNVPTNDEFIEMLKQRYNDTLDYSKVLYSGGRNKITLICPVHGEFKMKASHLLNYYGGCTICKNKEKFLDNVNKLHNYKYDYSLINYKNAKTKIDIICPNHGIFSIVPYAHSNGVGCPDCKRSKGEEEIKQLLDDNNIIYETQKTFNDCKNINLLKYDFYLPNYNICIEYDGIQHYKINNFFGGEAEFKKTQKRDIIKTEYCIKNNITLIRIKYDENVLEKLNILF